MSFFSAIAAFLRIGRVPREPNATRPAHDETQRSLPALAGRHFVLDGTNIALLHGPKKPELRYVLAIVEHLSKSGGIFICFFDANTRYLFRDERSEQLPCFEQLTTEEPWTAYFRVVPSGSPADPWILEHAKKSGAEVISNDRFRDRAKAHRWIWKRRHALEVAGATLCLPSLDLNLEPLARPEDYLRPDFLPREHQTHNAPGH